MSTPRWVSRFVRFFYSHFYNRLAWTYDPISALVSYGEWRAWTNTALPFVRGPRLLEIAVGTGNLQLDLRAAGFTPLGIDLSPYMIEITRDKLMRRGHVPLLARARVQALPYPNGAFDSLVMTFPPEFARDVSAFREMRRVLAPGGRLIWVDAPLLFPRDPWARFLDWLYHWTNSSPALVEEGGTPGAGPARLIGLDLPGTGWSWRIEQVERPRSKVHVMIGTREESIDE